MDELVKDLRESAPRALAEADFDFVEGWLKEAADAIEKLAEDNAALNGTVSNLIQQIAELSKPKWISATERLPEDLQNVLVIDDGRVSIGHCEHYYGEEQVYVEWHDTLYYPIDPPYWMPLPQPPKEGET